MHKQIFKESSIVTSLYNQDFSTDMIIYQLIVIFFLIVIVITLIFSGVLRTLHGSFSACWAPFYVETEARDDGSEYGQTDPVARVE